MKLFSRVAVVALLSAISVSATLLQGRITSNETLELDAAITISTLSPSPSLFRAPILQDKSFSIDLPEGDYVLRILNRKLDFQNYALRVSEHNIHAQIWFPGPSVIPRHSGPSLPTPLVIPALGSRVYTDPPAAFSILAVLKGNPLLLMLGVGALISFGLPTLLSSLDPETLKEVTDNQAQMHSKMASFQNVDLTSGISKFLASTDTDTSAQPGPPPVVAAPVASGGGKGRKRK